ncbi:MipA/OmpV family protein [Biostraticola tofi]|uniref:Putative outer membrane protein n=1 Tax=Biostraticola tofi TaxID=466109 RepID=A0A4R3Z646_9GAMM|nr:MipA/OmpV family protein [Biostraticola tofi]TCV99954.1 putative outer membrane protein [Biostraticola tofi]
MKSQSSLAILSLALAYGIATPAIAQSDLTIGAQAFYATTPYKGADDRTVPFPLLDYKGDNFYFSGLRAGYYLWKDPQNELSLTGYYSPWAFRPSKNDYGYMKQLDKRRSTVMAGLRYQHFADWGIVRAEYTGDILDNSGGFNADLAYLYRFTFDRLTLVPGIGATWDSEDQNTYYYGVSGDESRRSGLKRYHADDGWSPYVEMSAVYALTDNWSASAMARYSRLSDEIKDSPMVDRKSTTLVGVGMNYTF